MPDPVPGTYLCFQGVIFPVMINTAQLDEIKQLVARKIGLHIPPDANEPFIGILRERAARRNCDTLEEYRAFLTGHEAAGEWADFARTFTSNETFFFRDHGQFDLLHFRLLPELLEQHGNDKNLRLWSAGCASGEEAYSLAMLVDMLLPERGDWNVLILGTDIDSGAIAKAKQGRYGQWSFRMVPDALRRRYFRLEGNEWVLDERIRRMVTFRVANLVEDVFPDSGSELHDMDMILCRNVFIYFDPAAVSSVASKLSDTLVDGGYFMTAHTELIGHAVPGLESRLFAEGVVYRRHAHHSADVTLPPVAATVSMQVRSSLPVAMPGDGVQRNDVQKSPHIQNPAIMLCASAQIQANRGEYELAESTCRKALSADPLVAAPYFLLAQLAQFNGDFEQAKKCLNKAIYVDHRCVAAYLELAALNERTGDVQRAQALRHAVLGIVRTMPKGEQIDQYESSAGELAQWLEQWETKANNSGNADGS
jgi:chemotaxis protein methyltransferase CheR